MIEFFAAIPWEMRFRPGQDRVLQRQALSDLLPPRITFRTDKKGPDEAFYTGFQRNQALLRSLKEDVRIVDLGLVDGNRWREVVGSAAYGRGNSLPSILSAVSLELWLRQEA